MRVLVVDDEAPLADAIARGLKAEGFSVDVEHDGEQGLWRAQQGTYDAIILDIMLPKLNGYQVCAQLRAAEIWTPILMLTAKHGEYDEAEGLDTGADDYLTKPFSFVVLTARLRAMTRRPARKLSDQLRFADLTLDLTTQECTRDGEHISLTRREFSLLESLMRGEGDVVPKSELFDRIWGLEFDGDPNILDVYVSYLRKKVDKPFAQPLVHTVRGVGYRMHCE